MRVEVEGVITSIEEKVKEEKDYTEIMIAQKGIKEQVAVRLDGKVSDRFDLFEVARFSGRLITWKMREGIGSLVLADVV